MRITLRPAEERDIARIARLSLDAITDPEQGNPGGEFIRATHPRHETAAGRAMDEQRWLDVFRSPSANMLVAADADADDRPVAVAHWEVWDEERVARGYEKLELGDFWSGEEKEYGMFMWDETCTHFVKQYAKLPKPLLALEVLVVDTAYKRRGIGTMLLQEIVARADADAMTVFVSPTRPGRPLYEKFGFQLIEGHPLRYERPERWKHMPPMGSQCMFRAQGGAM